MYELRVGDLAEFFAVPFHCYGTHDIYVSPMRSDLRRILSAERNPLFRRQGAFACYTVRRDGDAVGRIVAHVHPQSNRRHGLARSYFGFFDCADDPAAARLLLDAAEIWARAHGCSEIAGNFNLTAMQQLGVVTDGFGRAPYTDMPYNPPHVPRLLEGLGYEPFFPMSTFEVALDGLNPATLLGPKERAVLRDPELRWAPLRRRRFRATMADVRCLLNASFDRNPLFVPLTEEEFLFQAGEMMWIVDERIAVLVYRGGEPVGVVVCIPDLNPFLRSIRSRLGPTTPLHFLWHRLRRRRAVIVFWAVAPSMQGRGLTAAMLSRVCTALKGAGYRRLGITWIADVNAPSLRVAGRLGAERLHRLHLYRKALAAS